MNKNLIWLFGLLILPGIGFTELVNAQSLLVPLRTPQPTLIAPPPLPGNPVKDDKVKSEIPQLFRDRADLLVTNLTTGELIACTLNMQVKSLTGYLVVTSTPWKCRITDLGNGVKQLETVLFERLQQTSSPSPENLIPTYVLIKVGAKPNTKTAISRQQAQVITQPLSSSFSLEGTFGKAEN